MNRKWLYGAALAAVIGITAVSVPGSASDRVASMELKSDGFDVQANFHLVNELLEKHFPHASWYHGPSFENFGTMYIDNEANQYVFLLDDMSTPKAQYFIRDTKAKFRPHVLIKQATIPYKRLRAIQDEIVETYEKQQVLTSVGVDVIQQKVKIEANLSEDDMEELYRKYGADVLDLIIYDPGAIAEDQNNGSFANIPDPVQQIGGPNDKVYWPPYEQNVFLNDERSKALDDEVHTKTGIPRFSGSLLDKYGLYVNREGEELPNGHLLFGINRLPDGMKTRIILTELEPYPSLKPIREISNDTFDQPHGMRVDFPDRLNTLYALNLELLNESGETVDWKVTVYAFEADEVNARMEADRDSYKPSDIIKIKITNWGPTSLQYGSWFAVQQWVSGEWKWLNGYQAFTMEARGIGPGGEVEDGVHLQGLGLEPGRYRIVKTFGGGTKSVALAAPFEVVAG